MTMMRSVWVSMICDSFRVSKWFAIASPRPTPRYVGLVNRRIADGGTTQGPFGKERRPARLGWLALVGMTCFLLRGFERRDESVQVTLARRSRELPEPAPALTRAGS